MLRCKHFWCLPAFILLSTFWGCKDNATQASLPPTESFDLLQEKIFTPSCALSGCHASTSDETYNQHHLLLEKSVSYSNLISVPASNANASLLNMLRVKPLDPDSSFLLHKLHVEDHHSSDFGNPMPLGLAKLTVGQLEFIEQWIKAGAPEKGIVADAALLDDITLQSENFEPLEAPENGKGFQVNIPKFSVAANFEREFFVFKPVGNDADVFVNRFEVKMRMNSHHLVIYDFDPALSPLLVPQVDVDRDIRNPDNSLNIVNMLSMPYHIFIFGSQSPYLNYEFPPGVAMRVKANAKLDFNSHYVNREAQPIPGEVNINFHTVPESSVVKEAKTLNMGNTNITLNPGERKTISKQFILDHPISVIALTSHNHELGEKFVIRIVGGSRDQEIVYSSIDWHHPIFVSYDPPIELLSGQGLMSEITYKNTRTTVVHFGLTSKDEMGIIFGYYIDN